MINAINDCLPVLLLPNLGNPKLISLVELHNANQLTFDGIIINSNIEELNIEQNINFFIRPILLSSGYFETRRGNAIPLKIKSIKEILYSKFDEFLPTTDYDWLIYDLSRNIKKIYGLFEEEAKLYTITFILDNIDSLKEIFKINSKNCILFDIYYRNLVSDEINVNYHSLAIFNKSWEEFTFIHASDLHIALRNDNIINFIKKKARIEKGDKNKGDRLDFKNKTFILNRDFEFIEEFQKEDKKYSRYARFNPNYNLRLFIEYINNLAMKNEIDFIIFSGDLVDYVQIAIIQTDYDNNFMFLRDIILGRDQRKSVVELNDKELINSHELLIPIITLIGNHDYRKEYYDLLFKDIYRCFGFLKNDVIDYVNKKKVKKFDAIKSKFQYLSDFLKYFNPLLNFKINVGKNCSLIFLNTGKDSVANMRNLIKGIPSSRGFKKFQIKMLRSFINNCDLEFKIIVMHNPPISSNINFFLQRKYKKLFHITKRRLHWSDFYEERLKDFFNDGRVDLRLNLKHECIMYNWSTFLNILNGTDEVIKTKTELVICGHTHTLREYRLRPSIENKKKVNHGYWFFPIYVTMPCEVYSSIYRNKINQYSEKEELIKWFNENKPFIFHTPALGLMSKKRGYKTPGFKTYRFQENLITKIKLFSLHIIWLTAEEL